MAEVKEPFSLIEKFRRIPFIARIALVVICILFLVSLIINQAYRQTRALNQRQLTAFKAAIGANSATELYNRYALTHAERGSGPGLPPEFLDGTKFTIVGSHGELDEYLLPFGEEGNGGTLAGEERLEAIADQEEKLDALARLLRDSASDAPFLASEGLTESQLAPDSNQVLAATVAITESALRACEAGRPGEAASRITVAFDLIDRLTDTMSKESQWTRRLLLGLLLDTIEVCLGDFEEEHLLQFREVIDGIDMTSTIEIQLQTDVLLVSEQFSDVSMYRHIFPMPLDLDPDIAFALFAPFDMRLYGSLAYPIAVAPLKDWDSRSMALDRDRWWAPATRLNGPFWWSPILEGSIALNIRLETLSESMRYFISTGRGQEYQAADGFRLKANEQGTWIEKVSSEEIDRFIDGSGWDREVLFKPILIEGASGGSGADREGD